MHLGSLYAAAASYLDALAHGGHWLLRMEDLDQPREVTGAAARILRTLEAFGFQWDGRCINQSSRLDAYAEALAGLHRQKLLFPCICSRAALADDDRYPGTCRDFVENPADAAIRIRTTPGYIVLHDRIQGSYRQDVAAATGDFVVRRRDKIVAYVLAVVVDDAAQGVTHVVRGADLLDNTPRQIYLQQLLGYSTPAYAHVPVLCEPGGAKLAKSRRSIAAIHLDIQSVTAQLHTVFGLLGLRPPEELRNAERDELWRWARSVWSIKHIPTRLALHLEG